RVAALVARGAFVPARVDRLGRERRGNLARKANDSACGEASAPSDLDVPGEQPPRGQAVSVGEEREVAAKLDRATDRGVHHPTLSAARPRPPGPDVHGVPAPHHFGGGGSAAVVRDDDHIGSDALTDPGTQRKVEPARLVVRRHDDGGAHGWCTVARVCAAPCPGAEQLPSGAVAWRTGRANGPTNGGTPCIGRMNWTSLARR